MFNKQTLFKITFEFECLNQTMSTIITYIFKPCKNRSFPKKKKATSFICNMVACVCPFASFVFLCFTVLCSVLFSFTGKKEYFQKFSKTSGRSYQCDDQKTSVEMNGLLFSNALLHEPLSPFSFVKKGWVKVVYVLFLV